MKSVIKKVFSSLGYDVVKHDIMKNMVHVHHLGFVGLDCRYILDEIISPDKVECCLDIGANVGQTAQKLEAHYPNAHIHSFEPMPSTFEKLKENLKGQSRVSCHNTALGDFESDSYIVYQQPNSEWNSLLEGVNVGEVGETIQVTTLDKFCDENNIKHIDILKSDTEGFEKHVFSGGSEVLKAGKIDSIYVEVGFRDEDVTHTNFFELSEILATHGFLFSGLFEVCYGGSPLKIAYANAQFVAKRVFGNN